MERGEQLLPVKEPAWASPLNNFYEVSKCLSVDLAVPNLKSLLRELSEATLLSFYEVECVRDMALRFEGYPEPAQYACKRLVATWQSRLSRGDAHDTVIIDASSSLSDIRRDNRMSRNRASVPKEEFLVSRNIFEPDRRQLFGARVAIRTVEFLLYLPCYSTDFLHNRHIGRG